jgi:transmembrane sensor
LVEAENRGLARQYQRRVRGHIEMTERQTNEEINEVAASWVARMDRGPLSAEHARGLEEWLSGDTRRLGAFAKARAVLTYSDRARALGKSFDPEALAGGAAPKINRRRAVMFGTAAAAAAGAAVFVRTLLPSAAQTFRTEVGETRVVALDDGSVVTLNTGSTVMVHYSRGRRDATILTGEALFDVARNPQRPFVVHARAAQVHAIGTSFAVLVLPESPVNVLVQEGIVELSRPADPSLRAVRVVANMRAIAPTDSPITSMRIAKDELIRALAWREGRIAFEGDTLNDAVATFARYSKTRLVISDPSVGAQRITGLFVFNDPVGFSTAVAISLNLHVAVREGEIELSR